MTAEKVICPTCGAIMRWFMGKYVCNCGHIKVPLDKDLAEQLIEIKNNPSKLLDIINEEESEQ